VSAQAESEALHARAVAFVEAYEHGAPMPEAFDALAVDLARFQARHVAGYGRLCAARDVDLSSLRRAGDAPAVPTDAFKLASVFVFDAAQASVTFRTSGTTIGARGSHSMRDVRTYDRAALASGRAMLAAGLRLPVPVLVIGPSAAEATDSSLSHMNTAFATCWGEPVSTTATYFVRHGELDVAGLRSRIAGLDPATPVIVLATSFALVHLLDALREEAGGEAGGDAIPLPAGSRVMQTGGFKGKAREVDAGELRRAVAHAFHVDPRAVVGEYGMTELSSQFWEATAGDPAASTGVYVEPPWARVVPVDPETLRPLPPGAVGIARIEDLANVDSAFAVLAQDRVRRLSGGFELLGRAPGAPPRGCSISLDEMLGGG
jgi:hypothetical protein